MTEHRHTWEIIPADPDHLLNAGFDIACQCGTVMSATEAECRLNATEILTKGKAETAASLVRGHTVKHDLNAYAKIYDK